MRRLTLWIASTLSALVLLFSYHTSTNASVGSSVVALAGTGSGASSGSGSSSSSGTTSGSTAAPETSAGTTYAGDAVSTRYGDVQVEITVADGKVTAARVLQVPWNDHRDQEINAAAVPILNEEAVAAQDADIDMVSGATYTSEGYVGSLQSALDRAGL